MHIRHSFQIQANLKLWAKYVRAGFDKGKLPLSKDLAVPSPRHECSRHPSRVTRGSPRAETMNVIATQTHLSLVWDMGAS